MKRSPLHTLIIIGVGTALFFLLGLFLAVPSPVPGGSLPIQYGLLSFLSVLYGPLVGLGVGLFGRLFLDLARGVGVWWSLIIASGLFGALMGLAGRRFRFCRRPFSLSDAATFILCEVACHLICWIVISPILDAVLYGEPYGQMLLQGLVTCAVSAVITAVVGVILCLICSAWRRRKGRRRREVTVLSPRE